MNQKELDKIIAKTRLGRISLRQCKKAYHLVFRSKMPEGLAYVNALAGAITKAGEGRVVNIIRAIDRIDGPLELIDGWEN